MKSFDTLHIQEGKDLTDLNTLRFTQYAERYIEVNSERQLAKAILLAKQEQWPITALGGGSNLVLTRDIPGLVIRQTGNNIQYSGQLDETTELVSVSAGTVWHDLVLDTIRQDKPGLENLALIPGSVGAAPVQNIGAYGVELCERFRSLRAINSRTGKLHIFNKNECDFSYRNSIFKNRKSEYIISHVTLALGKQFGLRTEYKALQVALQSTPNEQVTAQRIYETVCNIRRQKLPDPSITPNAGSFFHNPVVNVQHYQRLKKQHPKLPTYPVDNQRIKLAAGWMIDQLGFKGIEYNGVGVHKNQALVLTHQGGADGMAILNLAERIISAVQQHFGVELKIEPRVF